MIPPRIGFHRAPPASGRLPFQARKQHWSGTSHFQLSQTGQLSHELRQRCPRNESTKPQHFRVPCNVIVEPVEGLDKLAHTGGLDGELAVQIVLAKCEPCTARSADIDERFTALQQCRWYSSTRGTGNKDLHAQCDVQHSEVLLEARYAMDRRLVPRGTAVQ